MRIAVEVINLAAFVSIAVVAGSLGAFIDTWQYWALMFAALVLRVVNGQIK